jgi:hypothetical protein
MSRVPNYFSIDFLLSGYIIAYMPNLAAEIPTFLTPPVYEDLRVAYAGITTGELALRGLNHALRPRKTLPAEPAGLSFVIRYGRPGSRPKWEDTSFANAAPDAPYITADHLGDDLGKSAPTVTKSDIARMPKAVQEIWMRKGEVSLVRALVETLIYQPPEETRIISSPSAWLGTFKAAFQPGNNPGANRRILDEVGDNPAFSGAIALIPRQPDSTGA